MISNSHLKPKQLKTTILLFSFLLSFTLIGQVETPTEKPTETEEKKEKKEKKVRVKLQADSEIGVNMVLITRLLFNNENNIDLSSPYLFTYKRITEKGNGIRVGLGGSLSYVDLEELDRTDHRHQVDLRVGYEWQKKLTPKWLVYYGVDVISSYSNEGSKNDFLTSILEEWSLGGGPIMGLQWMINDRVGLSTEAMCYFRQTQFFDKIDFTDDFSVDDSSQFKTRNVDFILPNAVYLSVKF